MTALDAIRALRKEEEMTRTFIVLCILAILSLPFLIALDGFAIATLWRWFVVPTFHLPTLSVPVALGLATIVRYATSAHEDKGDEEEDKGKRLLTLWGKSLGKPVFALLFGRILLWFM